MSDIRTLKWFGLHMKRLALSTLLLLLTHISTVAQISNPTGIIASGGGLATDGHRVTRGIIAQTAVGIATDGSHDQRAGFLRVLAVATDLFPGTDPRPYSFELKQNYPNPFNPSTAIAYETVFPAWVRVTVYNMLGQIVDVLVDGMQPPGRHRILWQGTDRTGSPVASGIYVYRIETGRMTATRKMLLLR